MVPTRGQNAPGSTPDLREDPQPKNSAACESQSAVTDKPVVVGLFGISGCGKTFLLNQLETQLEEKNFTFFEGSKMIANVVPGGLKAFESMGDEEKVLWRQLAINTIGKECAESGQVAVVTGHFMFWPEGQSRGQEVYTENDLATFTHIVHLDVPPEVVAKRRSEDKERSRPPISLAHLRKWQEVEKNQLRVLCRNHGILFLALSSTPLPTNKISILLHDFRIHTKKHNLSCAESELDKVITAGQGLLETVLIIDADKTLAAEDTGVLFWKMLADSMRSKDEEYPLKSLFSSPLGHSYTAFRQATLLYEEAASDEEFDTICQKVASAVTMYPEFVSLLHQAGERSHIAPVIVTCGLRRVWENVLEREGLSDTVKVIGGGRISNGFVVSADVKGALVSRLRVLHQQYTWAFGDSPLDLAMLTEADQAVVVVGEEKIRSKSMEAALTDAIDNHGLRARQVVLPSNAAPRLNTTKLPLINLMEPELITSILRCRARSAGLRVLHATKKNSAKLLMTPMRDATRAGPDLRHAHRRVGWYLAIQFLSDAIGLETFGIPHVQGHSTSGYRLSQESQTTIVALMRGGEAMAFGVSDAFPLATFVHASDPADVKLHHLYVQGAVVLVDSVVNNGKTVVEFVQHIRSPTSTVRIVVVTGVAQVQSISEGGPIHSLGHESGLSLVALRLSDNKFTGKGTTDTGNRLFNTTHLS